MRLSRGVLLALVLVVGALALTPSAGVAAPPTGSDGRPSPRRAETPARPPEPPSPPRPLRERGPGGEGVPGPGGEGIPSATPEQLAALQAILDRPEFWAAEERGLLDRLLDPVRPWVRRALLGLLRLLGAGIEAGGVALWIGVATVALAIVGAALVIIRRLLRGTLASDAEIGAGRLGGPPRPQDELARARALAASGDARRAVHHHYLAVLLRLDERDHLPFDGALTNRELLPRLDAPPGLADPFAELVARFDRLWYGQSACSPEEYAAFARLANRVWAAAEAQPPRQVTGTRQPGASVSAALP